MIPKANGANSFSDLLALLTKKGISFTETKLQGGALIRLFIEAKPNSKKEGVIQAGENLKVSTRAPATEGRANEGIIEVLSESLGVSKSSITILKGHESKKKLIEICYLVKMEKNEQYYIEKWHKVIGE